MVACLIALAVSQSASQEADWRNDWAVVDERFAIRIDTSGYHFPTAIAFIPNPGPKANDPLYFVTELRGRVKVVTNDRSVYTFAEDFFHFQPKEELPLGFEGQSGLAGICLAPKYGYVFVTYVYRDPHDTVIRNNVVRFRDDPGDLCIATHIPYGFYRGFLSLSNACDTPDWGLPSSRRYALCQRRRWMEPAPESAARLAAWESYTHDARWETGTRQSVLPQR
jgi:hypothetical protein